MNALRSFLVLLRRVAVWLLLLPIRFYQLAISPYTPPACRFTPTCSEYAKQAIIKHGPFKGLALAVWRLLRCNPWGGNGYDPVPGNTNPKPVTRLLIRELTKLVYALTCELINLFTR